jgi:hypothetical protein
VVLVLVGPHCGKWETMKDEGGNAELLLSRCTRGKGRGGGRGRTAWGSLMMMGCVCVCGELDFLWCVFVRGIYVYTETDKKKYDNNGGIIIFCR